MLLIRFRVLDKRYSIREIGRLLTMTCASLIQITLLRKNLGGKLAKLEFA